MELLVLWAVGTVVTLLFGSQFKHSNNPRNIAGDFGASGGAEGESSSSDSERRTAATPEEEELNKLDMELRRGLQSGLMDVNTQALSLAGNLLKGQDLPGYLNRLPGGISPDVTQDIVDRSLKDVGTAAQFQGILDSGTTAELATDTASKIRNESEQYNLQLLLQLLNLGVGGSTQIQQPINQMSSTLSQRLAGLRQVNTTGNASSFGWDAKANADMSFFDED